MKITVRHVAGVQFAIEARGHQVMCDQPTSDGGTDTGMTPPELLLASLGSCAAYYAEQYLRTRSLPDNGLSVAVTAEKTTAPARLDFFNIAVSVPTLSDPRHVAGVRASVERCLIHNTLLHAPSIQIHVSANAGETVSSVVAAPVQREIPELSQNAGPGTF